jgi:hypothetical protein
VGLLTRLSMPCNTSYYRALLFLGAVFGA